MLVVVEEPAVPVRGVWLRALLVCDDWVRGAEPHGWPRMKSLSLACSTVDAGGLVTT